MSFIKTILFSAECNQCGETFGHKDSMEELVELMEECGWIVMGEEAYCPNCIDEDKLKSYRQCFGGPDERKNS